MSLTRYIARGLLAAGAVIILLATLVVTVEANGAPRARLSAPTADWGGKCRYVVHRGENLFRIGVRHGVSWWYLAQINGLHNPNYIWAGMVLTVPCGGQPPKYTKHPPKERPKKPEQPCVEPLRYTVRRGDNLFRIALNHGSTVEAIRDANQLWGRVLIAGTELIIPCRPHDHPIPERPVAPEATPLPVNGTTVPPPGPTELLPEPSAQVILYGDRIDPNSASVRAGQSVVWVNASDATYTLVSGMPGQPNSFFSSPPLPPGGTFVFKFDAAGNYLYYINQNPALTGQVNVTP
jgi:LysM repeat protein